MKHVYYIIFELYTPRGELLGKGCSEMTLPSAIGTIGQVASMELEVARNHSLKNPRMAIGRVMIVNFIKLREESAILEAKR